VYSLARASAFRQQLEGMVTGTSKSHQRVQPDAMLNLDIAIPSSEVLGAFDAAVALSLARCRANIAESRTLATLRDALLPKLLSGELRVEDAEHVVARLA
jgi:type I restriction enzyme S subunit